MAEHTLTETDNNRTVSVSVGDRIVLRLGESSGAGYGWDVENYGVDPDVDHPRRH